MVRWAPRLAWACLLLGAIPLHCSNPASSSDGGADAFVSTPCSTNADCPTGTACLFTGTGGCSETPRCLPPPAPGACKAAIACSCGGQTVSVCGGVSVPIRSFGACDGGTCGGDCCATFACELCDVSGYSPMPMSTPIATLDACTPTEIVNAVGACYGTNATPQTCAAWQAAEADAGAGACAGCIVSDRSSAAWGPLVCTAGACSLNTPGCVDLVVGQVTLERSSAGTGSCGDRLSDAYGCEDYSCATCSTADFPKCAQAATTNECKGYADAVDWPGGPCAVLDGDASPPAALNCFPSTDSDVAKLVNVFCGTGP